MPDDAPTLDLNAFDFRPAWAKDPAPGAVPVFREERPPRGPKPKHHGGPARRPGGPNAGPRRGPHKSGPRHGPRHDEPPAPPPNPFPWLRFAFTATAPAVETVAKQIRQTGKTFSLFDLARILLRNPASYTVDLSSAPPPATGPFYTVPSDGSVWMSLENAARHLLQTRRDEFYRAETVDVEPPKGNFPVVAVCGLSGTLLGPPNHHDFERCLRELHRSRFAGMDFEHFRGRLKMERDPEIIGKWKTEASKTTVYYPVGDGEPVKLADLAAVEKHFLAHHAPALVEAAPKASVPGDPKKVSVDRALAPLLNHVTSEEQRFPLRLAQSLSRSLSAAGLRFHKSPNRTTFVSASRPRHLNLDEVAVSDSIRKILETIRAKKSLRRAQLLDLLAPAPDVVAASPENAAPPAAESPASPAPPVPADPVREAVINDLLWLTHEGYVIEYADSRLESVPPPKNPPKPPAEAPAEAASQHQQPEA